MAISSTTSTSSTAATLANLSTSTTSTPASSNPQGTLTAQDFMQLLTVQMENQDPTTPMDSNQEMQQIVHISSMQNMSTMSADLTQMTASQTWSLANSYLGRQVTLNDTNGNAVAGQITAINTSSSTPTVQVNGTYYPLTSLTSIQLPTTSSSSSTTSTTTPPASTTPASTTPATTTSTATSTKPASVASSIINAILPSN